MTETQRLLAESYATDQGVEKRSCPHALLNERNPLLRPQPGLCCCCCSLSSASRKPPHQHAKAQTRVPQDNQQHFHNQQTFRPPCLVTRRQAKSLLCWNRGYLTNTGTIHVLHVHVGCHVAVCSVASSRPPGSPSSRLVPFPRKGSEQNPTAQARWHTTDLSAYTCTLLVKSTFVVQAECNTKKSKRFRENNYRQQCVYNLFCL